MFTRRVLYYWQFIAAVLLPTWVIVGRLLFGSEMGWDILLYLVLSPLLAVAMIAVAGVTTVRKAVRDSKALSWQDAAFLAPWHLAIIAFGLFDVALLAVLIVLLAVAAFWSAAWQLFTETRSRVKKAFALPDFPVAPGRVDPGNVETGHYDATPTAESPDAGTVIIAEPGSFSDK